MAPISRSVGSASAPGGKELESREHGDVEAQQPFHPRSRLTSFPSFTFRSLRPPSVRAPPDLMAAATENETLAEFTVISILNAIRAASI